MAAAKRVKFKTTQVGERQVISLSINGEPEVVDDSHPNWDKIVAAAKADDMGIVDLINPKKDIEHSFKRYSDRLTIQGRYVYWDGDKMNNTLARKILEFHAEGLDVMGLVNFFDKVSQNPSKHSRDQLYNWLSTHKFTITQDGDILGYKGYSAIAKGEKGGATLRSTAAGHAFVNDKEFNGLIPCKKGDVVTMPRHEVADNPQAECSHGLHVGTPSYAKGYGTVRMAVLINPRDVVSVPDHDAYHKMRVCRYYVLDEAASDHVSQLMKGAPKWEPEKPVAPEVEMTQEAAGLGEVEAPEQPESTILADEKPAAKARRTTKVTSRPSTKAVPEKAKAVPEEAKPKKGRTNRPPATTMPPKPEPSQPGPKPDKVDWSDPKNVDKLLAAPNNEAMKREFPSLSLSTLQKRAREERAKRGKTK